jgi:WhiB family transcriptional regulator, redox-sensing transcriptional regulator
MPQQSAARRPDLDRPAATQVPGGVSASGVAGTHYVPSTPENWFVDPIRLGVPGVRQPSAPGTALPGASDDNPLAWQSDSLCAQTDPEAFFPEKGGSTRDAKKICGSCEVRVHCLEYALENDERFGIWGGLSERERRKLRKRA